MTCECEYCRGLSKPAQENQKCQVDELRTKCKSMFSGWTVSASYDYQNNKSRLYILKKSTQILRLDIDQITKITNLGYFVIFRHSHKHPIQAL